MRLIDADSLPLGKLFYSKGTKTQLKQSIISAVANAPVFEPEKGNWSDCESHSSFKRCSVCGRERSVNDSWWSYCPNCGAEMDGEQT